MDAFITRRGGGSSLNFAVVGGETAPANPKENTVWIETGTEITSWVFSATEPENPQEGKVWITTGRVSNVDFNAVKENDVRVYPVLAKQYTNGAWEGVSARIFQNGQWVEWKQYLYNLGDECINIAGGWVGFQLDTETFYPAGCVKGSDRLTIMTATSKTCAGFGTVNMVDLSLYNRVEFEVPYMKSCCRFGVSKYRNTNTWDYSSAYVEPTGGMTNGIISVDVSNLTGSYYIYFGDWHSSYAENTQVTKVWLV